MSEMPDSASERYRLIFESVKDLLVQLDRGGQIVDLNQQVSHISGYKKEDLIGKRINSLASVFTAKSLVLIVANFAKRMLGFHIKPYEVEAKSVDGRQLFFEIDAVSLKEPNGQSIGELAVLHDVTEQKQATAKLKESEERFRSVVGSASIGLLSLNSQGIITFAEGLGLGVLKIKMGEILGRPGIEVFAQAPEFLAGFRRAIGGDSSSSVIELAELVFECRFSPLADQDKKIIGATVVLAEITERQRAEEAMRATQRFLEISNKETQRDPLLGKFVSELLSLTGCSAVGIFLLNEQKQLLCQASQGFSPEYGEVEAARLSKSGEAMDCKVLYGGIEPNNPYCTRNGSFYLNNVSSFLKTATEEQKKWGCDLYQKFGCESVAFIPIRLGERVLGLIQLADQGANKIPLKKITILEDVAKQLALAVQKMV